MFSSDLDRAVQTAAIAFGSTGIPVLLDWRLRECDYGQLNGSPAAGLHAHRGEHVSVPYPDGESWRQAAARVASFAADLPSSETDLMARSQVFLSVKSAGAAVSSPAWKTKPSWFIVANQDRSVNPDLERFVAKRMGAKTYDIDSSHVPMLSHPDFVLDVIRTAAASI